MKKIIALLLPLLILCSLTACGSSKKIRFGTAGIGGNYYLFGQTLTEYVSQDTDLNQSHIFGTKIQNKVLNSKKK